MRRLLLFLFCLFCAGLYRAGASAVSMESANEAYRNKQFQEAARQYEALLTQGYRSATLYYNLGNACYRSGRPGRAILNYERALLLDPGDPDTKHNLEVLRKELPDKLETVRKFFLWEWWHQLRMLSSATVWSILGLLFVWTGTAGLLLWLFGNTRTRKKQGFISGLVLMLLSALVFGLAFSRQAFDHHPAEAIVLEKEVALRTAPDPESLEILTIHEGLKVKMLDKIGEWEKVRLQNGEVGWLPESVIEEI